MVDPERSEVAPLGVRLTVGAAAGGATLTVTDLLAVAPAVLAQVSVKVLPVARGPRSSEPAVALAPVQAPEAVQPVALVEVQVSVTVLPDSTVSAFEVKTSVGAGGGGGGAAVTVTVVVAEMPPQVSVELDVVVGKTACVPVRPLVPLQAPDAVHVVAFCTVQDSVLERPLTMLAGVAVMFTTGAGGAV